MKKGFTLVELVVVIAIIGTLAAIVLPTIDKARARGRDGRRVADISQLRLALEHYFNKYNKYPITLTDVNLTSGGIITQAPRDPSTDALYTYVAFCSPSGLITPIGYHLGATLEQPHEQLSADSNDAAVSSGFCTGGASVDFSGADTPTLTNQVYDFKR